MNCSPPNRSLPAVDTCASILNIDYSNESAPDSPANSYEAILNPFAWISTSWISMYSIPIFYRSGTAGTRGGIRSAARITSPVQYRYPDCIGILQRQLLLYIRIH